MLDKKERAHACDVIYRYHMIYFSSSQRKNPNTSEYAFRKKTTMADETRMKNVVLLKNIKEKAKLCCDSPKFANNILDIINLAQVMDFDEKDV